LLFKSQFQSAPWCARHTRHGSAGCLMGRLCSSLAYKSLLWTWSWNINMTSQRLHSFLPAFSVQALRSLWLQPSRPSEPKYQLAPTAQTSVPSFAPTFTLPAFGVSSASASSRHALGGSALALSSFRCSQSLSWGIGVGPPHSPSLPSKQHPWPSPQP